VVDDLLGLTDALKEPIDALESTTVVSSRRDAELISSSSPATRSPTSGRRD
jgi:hypothetical protein